MPTIRTQDGVNIAYKTYGMGPQNLLFMHGWGGSGAFFDETLRHLDVTGLRAITYDLRGHGASDKPASGYTLDCFAQDAFAVADAAEADKVVVIGYSMSGKFAQYMACVQPERVAGLILVGPAPAAKLPVPTEVHSDWVSRAGNREKLMELERMFITRPVRSEVVEHWGDDVVKVPQFVLDETLNMCEHTSFADRLDGLQAPTLVIGGVHDALLPPDALRQGVVAPLSKARLAVLDSNHDIPIEVPQEFAALIQAFLAGLLC